MNVLIIILSWGNKKHQPALLPMSHKILSHTIILDNEPQLFWSTSLNFGEESLFIAGVFLIKIFFKKIFLLAVNDQNELKLIKSYLKTTMSENRLSGLALLSIEREQASNVNFERIIDTFAKIKKTDENFGK